MGKREDLGEGKPPSKYIFQLKYYKFKKKKMLLNVIRSRILRLENYPELFRQVKYHKYSFNNNIEKDVIQIDKSKICRGEGTVATEIETEAMSPQPKPVRKHQNRGYRTRFS